MKMLERQLANILSVVNPINIDIANDNTAIPVTAAPILPIIEFMI